MTRRSLLLLLAASGCQRERAPVLQLSGALSLAARQSGLDDDSLSRASAEMARLVEVARHELATTKARSPAAVLSSLIFDAWGFTREVEDTSLRYVLLPSVLEHRRGGCVGLGSLFLGIAEGLGWAAAGVLMPGHFYVRVREPSGTRNVELLRAGEAMPNSWYDRRYPVSGGHAREYARPLKNSEVLGVVHFDVGNERRRQRRYPEARAALERAALAFPDLAEAHASLGAVQQLLGDLRAASESYVRARNANPNLPGVVENSSLLEAEWAASVKR
ncbi:MAG TPA: transglutaminase family protein [Polyangiaceae bacterium]|nr:transglutaminase family protein [Polyangiaceae bacterium]